jgi:hypothetical protein
MKHEQQKEQPYLAAGDGLAAPESRPLSPTMLAAFEHAKAHGGAIVRYPGGFWYAADRIGGKSFGTPTVEGLVSRGAATYTEWQEGRNGRFPIRATLNAEAAS